MSAASTPVKNAGSVLVFPIKSKTGIDVMSMNLLLEKETDPVAWRGPIIAGTVKQSWTDVIWNEVDFMFFDIPPGNGDAAYCFSVQTIGNAALRNQT